MGRAKAERIPTGVWNIRCSNACYSSVSLAYYFITDRNCGLYLYEFQCVSLFSFSFSFFYYYLRFIFLFTCVWWASVCVCVFFLSCIFIFLFVYTYMVLPAFGGIVLNVWKRQLHSSVYIRTETIKAIKLASCRIILASEWE